MAENMETVLIVFLTAAAPAFAFVSFAFWRGGILERGRDAGRLQNEG
jgi:hypothetical protein